jgi:hypothetical protein
MLSFVRLSVIMLNATYKPFVLNVVMLSVVRLIVVMLNVEASAIGKEHLCSGICLCK